MGPFLRYTVLRLGLFAAALVVFALLGAGGWLLVVLAAVASLALSLVLLRGPRDEVSQALARRSASGRRRERRLEEDEAAEDAAVDDVRPPPDDPRPDDRG